MYRIAAALGAITRIDLHDENHQRLTQRKVNHSAHLSSGDVSVPTMFPVRHSSQRLTQREVLHSAHLSSGDISVPTMFPGHVTAHRPLQQQ